MAAGHLERDVTLLLSASGWNENLDRSAMIREWDQQLGPHFVLTPAAMDVLSRYGGVTVVQSGAGEECTRESFTLNPVLAVGEEDRFDAFRVRLGQEFYPLGEAGNGHAFLAVAADGSVWGLMEDAWLLGGDIEEAITSLVRGRNALARYDGSL